VAPLQGDKNAADQAAVDMMRKVLATVQMDGVVVIGEGEKDVRPILGSAPLRHCYLSLLYV
jgi:fructose-1,6-bisphosphatase/sedoheptulose 1,7-bisphosphatase-like protein